MTARRDKSTPSVSPQRNVRKVPAGATVRVQSATRDELNAEAKASGLSVDAVVRKALAAMRRAALERQAAEELAALANDPADRAELARAQADLRGYE